jgi:hypothetical protein
MKRKWQIAGVAIFWTLQTPGHGGQPVGPEFLDVPAAAAAIADESSEPYFSLLRPAEMRAKTGRPLSADTLEEQRAETRRQYSLAVLSFTHDEKQAIAWYIARIEPILRQDYPKLASVPWRFIKIADSIEGGLPHTRGDHIVLSQSVVSRMRLSRDQLGDLAVTWFGKLLIHEQLHVMQRQNPDLFRELYTRLWSFEHADRIELPAPILERAVVNPDGVDVNWVYAIRRSDGRTRYITPRLVWAQGVDDPQMPQDFRMVAIELVKAATGFTAAVDSAGAPIMLPLHQERLYLPHLRREPISGLYHPHEIAADLLAHIVTIEHLLPRESAAPLLESMQHNLGAERAWFAEHLR